MSGGRWTAQAQCGGCGRRGDAPCEDGAVATSDHDCENDDGHVGPPH